MPDAAPTADDARWQPVAAGVVAGLVGFASTFALILAALRAVGASSEQASSGLLALSLGMGVTGVLLSVRFRMPISIAWSTPGAALLLSTGAVAGGFSAAVGAFLLCGGLIILAGMWRALGRWLAAIPPAIASAMLAGVLLPVCLAPVRAVVAEPWLAGPGVVVWIAVSLVRRPLALPAALAATVAAIAIAPREGAGPVEFLPDVVLTAPTLTWPAVVGIALPLFIVTMASQNVPGMTVLASFGYRPPLRSMLLATGTATVATAPFGAHAINLAAITAALCAGPDAHPDPARRWVAGTASGVLYLFLGLCAGLAVALVGAAPPLVIESVAGLALLGALAMSLKAALDSEEHREAATVTFLVSASAITVLGITAPFWGLVAGLVLYGLQRAAGRRRNAAVAEAPRRDQ